MKYRISKKEECNTVNTDNDNIKRKYEYIS